MRARCEGQPDRARGWRYQQARRGARGAPRAPASGARPWAGAPTFRKWYVSPGGRAGTAPGVRFSGCCPQPVGGVAPRRAGAGTGNSQEGGEGPGAGGSHSCSAGGLGREAAPELITPRRGGGRGWVRRLPGHCVPASSELGVTKLPLRCGKTGRGRGCPFARVLPTVALGPPGQCWWTPGHGA